MRGRRMKHTVNDDITVKIIKYASIGVGILAIIVLGLLFYSKKLNDQVKSESLTNEQIADILDSNENEESESVSTEMGKSVNEASNELQNESSQNSISNTTQNANNNIKNTTNNSNTSNNIISSNSSNNTTNNTSNNVETKNQNTNTQQTEQEKSQELNFSKPVDGDIIREFAKDNLIYSQTLEEWTTHTGIDIKADKTTVVKAAEAGTVKTIKNDPRYGLTIVVEHKDGFQTVYSNLLTSEFVVEGEKVEKGQSLGTVGNTAAFEIADEPHLHFEILKDSVAVDPSIYIK